jgi:hypothetical protein
MLHVMTPSRKIETVIKYGDISPTIDRLELEWINETLVRSGIPPIMLIQAPNMSKSAWRDYLFDTHGMYIIKDLASGKVVITKINLESGEKIIIGEWSKPEIIKNISGKTPVYDLVLKCWQIV